MYIARILYPIEVLGPGKRIGIWFCGCPHHCKGCSNPELWEINDKYSISTDDIEVLIESIAENGKIDGFTLTGGDPFYQYEDMMRLIKKLKNYSEDILVYTGYTIEELNDKPMDGISVLIDGKYVEELNDSSLLRGSSNQKIHILDSSQKDKYEKYLSTESNKIQNFAIKDGVISVGIHRSDFMKEAQYE